MNPQMVNPDTNEPIPQPEILIDFDSIIKQDPSNNYSKTDKKGIPWFITPKMIVIHWTAGKYKNSIHWLKNPLSQVSAHYVIDSTGTNISQLVALNRRAWQCGGSYHPMLPTDTNANTIGIEIEGPPSLINALGWNINMIDVLAQLCKYIKNKCPSIIGIVDHSTIFPKSKKDVKIGIGIDKFPWDYFILKTEMTDYTTEPYSTQIRKFFNI
jgi:N-acetyl-anhydromuramyl-L-alanine amidase AmpD